jgi:pimeloyl-ACP methyl ester carboxylesterase
VIRRGAFVSGDNELFYVCNIPDMHNKNTGVIFVHAADGNRIGPHRMFVEMAAKLNHLGFATMRFDLTGCGDSSGTVSRNDVTPDITDVVAAIDFFMSLTQIKSVCLFAISRGARICFSLIAKHKLPVSAAILLSTPVSTTKTAVSTLSSRMHEYLCKLKNPQNLWKLLAGRANLVQIGGTLLTAIHLRHRYSQVEESKFASRCPILFIYGQNDPITAESAKYCARICNENALPYECHIIKGANHSYFHYLWKQRIFEISQQWLLRLMEKDEFANE